LSNLVANSPEEYVKIAAAISADHGQREVLRQALRSRLKESGQLSSKRLATNLERAFQRAWEGLAKGEQAAGFDVEPVIVEEA
jgi:predicted O-linked N-acetylglucosamine transferase (SPINDLY family)